MEEMTLHNSGRSIHYTITSEAEEISLRKSNCGTQNGVTFISVAKKMTQTNPRKLSHGGIEVLVQTKMTPPNLRFGYSRS
jgi:hypothetical protein